MVHLGVDYDPEVRPAIHVHGPNGLGVDILSKVDPSAAPAGHATVALIKLLKHEEARTWFPEEPSQWEGLASLQRLQRTQARDGRGDDHRR